MFFFNVLLVSMVRQKYVEVSVDGFAIYDRLEARTGIHWTPNQPQNQKKFNTTTVGPTTNITYQTPGYKHKWPINSIAAPHDQIARKQFNDEIEHPSVKAGKPNRPIYKHAVGTMRMPFQNGAYPGPYPADQNYGPNGSSNTTRPGLVVDAETQLINPITFMPLDKAPRPARRPIRVKNNGNIRDGASDVVVPEYPLNNRGINQQPNCTVEFNGAINQKTDWERTKTKPFFMLERCPSYFGLSMPGAKSRGGNMDTGYVAVDAALSVKLIDGREVVCKPTGIQVTDKGSAAINAKGQTGGQYNSNVWEPADDDLDQYPYDPQQEASFCVIFSDNLYRDRLALASVDNSGTGFQPLTPQGGNYGDATGY